MKTTLFASILMAATFALTGCGKEESASEPQGFVIPQKSTPMSTSEALAATGKPADKQADKAESVPSKPFEEYLPVTGNAAFLKAEGGGFYRITAAEHAFRFVTAYNEKDQGLDVYTRLDQTPAPYGDMGVTLRLRNAKDFMFVPGTKETFAKAESFRLYVHLESIDLNVPTSVGRITKLEVLDKDGAVLGSHPSN